MLNILFLSELFYPHGGGAELATHLYARLLSEAGVNVAVITNQFAGESEVAKSKNLVINRWSMFKGTEHAKYSILSRFDLLFSSSIRKKIKWADIVYIPRFWYSAIPFVKLYRKPVIVHLHDYIPVCPLSNYYDTSEGRICKRKGGICSERCIYTYEKTQSRSILETISSMGLNATLGSLWGKYVSMCDAIICVSKTHAGIIGEANPSLLKKIHIICNPIPNISYSTVEKDDFGYFGGPDYSKGFHIMYKALKCINRSNRQIIKVHASNFSQSPKFNRSDLRERGFVIYGKLAGFEYEKVYKQIRCVIVPSMWYETFSYVTLEALLHGRLLIASERGAIPEMVEGCDGALLFSPGDYEELTEKMLCIKGLNRETVIDLGKRNREIAINRFSNENSVSKFMNLLNLVLQN